MAKVVIRNGSDWLNVTVDGSNVIHRHSGSPSNWAEVMEKCGVEVVEEEGDFCSWCTNWTTEKLVRRDGEDVCPTCANKG